MIKLKSPENIAAMQRAGRLAGEVREAVKAYAKVGMTTREWIYTPERSSKGRRGTILSWVQWIPRQYLHQRQ